MFLANNPQGKDAIERINLDLTKQFKYLDPDNDVDSKIIRYLYLFDEDEPIRGNSTFYIFKFLMHFKEQVDRLIRRDRSIANLDYFSPITSKEWEVITSLLPLLKFIDQCMFKFGFFTLFYLVFFNILRNIFFFSLILGIENFSASDKPTATEYFHGISEVFVYLNHVSSSGGHLGTCAEKMIVELKKYWSEPDPLLTISSIFDPGSKLGYIEFAMDTILAGSVTNNYIIKLKKRYVMIIFFFFFSNYFTNIQFFF